MVMQFDVVVVKDRSGGYIGFVPILPGCHSQGDNWEELTKNIEEAAKLYLETLSKEERKEILKQANEFMAVQKVKINA